MQFRRHIKNWKPSALNLERMLAPAVRQAAFEMFCNRRMSTKEIAAALQISCQMVKTIRRKDSWVQRVEDQVRLLRENYDANVATMVENRNPLMVHHELNAVALADQLVEAKFKRAIRREAALPHDAPGEKVTDLTRALKTTVEARAKLVEPTKKGPTGKGDTFIGRAVIIGGRSQPLRKHIETTAKEIPADSPTAFF